MKKPSTSERFRYWFDGWMSRGTGALIGLLGLATLILVIIVGLLVLVTGQFPDPGTSTGDPIEVFWNALMHTLDSGAVGADAGWGFRGLMLIVTVGGLIIVASLIGIISGAFDARVEELRKGRSKVLEKDHTLILGWSSKVFPIVSELCIANESRRRSVIVILAAKDKVEMEDELRSHLGKTGRTRIICRSGDPMSLTDLSISSPHDARSIIVLAADDSPDPDSDVIKTTLALTNNPHRKPEPYHIIGEIEKPSNLEAARLVGRDDAHWLLGRDIIGRITVQSCRQSGLSAVYSELLDFEGDEIYFTDQPTLYGKTYFDAQLAFADSAVMGIVKAGTVQLNPTDTMIYEPGDLLIVIAEDDSTIKLAKPGTVDHSAVGVHKAVRRKPEHTLVLGYNRGLRRMLRELDDYVAPGSAVTVLADVKAPELPQFANLKVEFKRGDATSRAVLESLDVAAYMHIIVLAYEEVGLQRADAKTLITLLQLRDIQDRSGLVLNIVSEMLDDRNRELAEVTRADDFIVSDKLISLMLSQVSENKHLKEVFDDLFSSEGSEIYLNPVENYVEPGTDVDFYTVLEAARRRGETAIGYRIVADSRVAERSYGVRINPLKTERVAFTAGDRIVVLGEG